MLTETQFLILKSKALEFRHDKAWQRIVRLKKVKSWIAKNEEQIINALKADFSKPEFETRLTEITPVYSEIDFFIKHLSRWMKDQKVPTPITLLGHSSSIRYENKGVILIISPWNYPFYLAIVPFITALAAGNTAVLKPSELTPHTSNVISKLVQDCFTSGEAVVVLGDKSATENLLTYHFDHVFFTGSTAVGRIIAKACADKLIPMTLELGGKSPTIVDETADIHLACEKIFWGKFLNRGQTCVAPDYVIVHKSVQVQFEKEMTRLENLHELEIEGKIINQNHEARLNTMVQKPLGFFNQKALEVKPVSDLSDATMKDEIFGPVLPVLTYETHVEIDAIIKNYEKPLAMYIFSKNKTFIESILKAHTSGGVAINTVIMHLANPYLPFGGVGASGMGRYHGWHGFVELSHQRAIIRLKFFKSLTQFLLPPYTPVKLKLIRLLK
ncbi:MAG: aldehyde dehydrogenase family protein [Bdellovibrio sp.]|nr:aldehyde dehydrogenase family protein [Bdellovibrio sp.]